MHEQASKASLSWAAPGKPKWHHSSPLSTGAAVPVSTGLGQSSLLQICYTLGSRTDSRSASKTFLSFRYNSSMYMNGPSIWLTDLGIFRMIKVPKGRYDLLFRLLVLPTPVLKPEKWILNCKNGYLEEAVRSKILRRKKHMTIFPPRSLWQLGIQFSIDWGVQQELVDDLYCWLGWKGNKLL